MPHPGMWSPRYRSAAGSPLQLEFPHGRFLTAPMGSITTESPLLPVDYESAAMPTQPLSTVVSKLTTVFSRKAGSRSFGVAKATSNVGGFVQSFSQSLFWE